jgi:3'(2'), 5'-bisphosphate nucleotidase
MPPSERLQKIIDLAKRAGAEIMRYYDADYSVRDKANHTQVTDADMAADKMIREFLLENFPYPVLSEETLDDPARLTADTLWIVDPLDGTRDFINHSGEFCVMIGLLKNSRPELGVVYVPIADTVYFAEHGKGAFRIVKNAVPEPIHVSDHAAINHMTVIVGRAKEQVLTYKVAQDLGAKQVDRVNSVGIKAARLAEGRADIYLNATRHASEWDTCAADIIITEAGGKFTDLYGHTLRYNLPDVTHYHGLLGTNGIMHDDIAAHIDPLLPKHNISLPN